MEFRFFSFLLHMSVIFWEPMYSLACLLKAKYAEGDALAHWISCKIHSLSDNLWGASSFVKYIGKSYFLCNGDEIFIYLIIWTING